MWCLWTQKIKAYIIGQSRHYYVDGMACVEVGRIESEMFGAYIQTSEAGTCLIHVAF